MSRKQKARLPSPALHAIGATKQKVEGDTGWLHLGLLGRWNQCASPGIVTAGLNNTGWQAAGMLVGVSGVDPVSLGARLITFSYGFLILIMVGVTKFDAVHLPDCIAAWHQIDALG